MRNRADAKPGASGDMGDIRNVRNVSDVMKAFLVDELALDAFSEYVPL